jgi:hypothetical protein
MLGTPATQNIPNTPNPTLRFPMLPTHHSGAALDHDDETDDMFRELVLALVPHALPAWTIPEIERQVGAEPGDLLSGRILPLRMSTFRRHIEVGLRIPGHEELVYARVELIDKKGVREIAETFKVLADWAERAKAPKAAKDGKE